MRTISTQQVFAPSECGVCAEFEKLTNEFEKDVLAAGIGNPEFMVGLLVQ
jgi:hypothetical protein